MAGGASTDPGGTGCWHETYCARGGMEAIYLELSAPPLGLGAFTPREPARTSMFSARKRLGLADTAAASSAVAEEDLYRE